MGPARSGVRRLLGVVALTTLVATACTGEDGVQVREAKAGAQTGGTLTVAIEEPRSIDPPAATPLDLGGSAVVRMLCDRLIELDPVTGEPKPGIAESWIVSDGGERMTVKLRKGVRFHNGDELVAEDVVYSLSRVADRDFASPSSDLMQPVIGYDQVHGNEEVEEGRFRRQLRGLRVIENFSFEVQLSRDQSDFVRALAHVATSIVPKQVVEDDPNVFARQPVCTGPYRMAQSWSPGDSSITLERFDDYYGENTAYTRGGGAYPERIEFKIYPDRQAQLEAFQAGEVDVADIPQAAELAQESGASVVIATTPTLEYIGLPTSQEPFDKRGARIAMSQALDRRAILEEVYGGVRESAAGILPPAVGDVHRERSCADRAPLEGDMEAARETLRSAGVDLSGETIKFYFNDEFGHRRLAEAVTARWSEVFGAEFELVGMGWDEYLEGARGQSGFDGPFRMSWRPDYVSPDQYLQPLFHSNSIGQNNFTRYSNRDFDQSLEDGARRAISDRDIREQYQILENMVCGDLPVVPLDYGARVYAVNEGKVQSAVDPFWDVSSGTFLLREAFVR